jgi:uncharacterized protein (TIGR02300 family)
VVDQEWGIKRTCHACGAKYYDFKKKTPTCPSCQTAFDPEALLKSRRRNVPEEKVKKPEVVEEVEAADEEVEPAAEGEVIESTEDLADGDEAVVAAEPEEAAS